VKGGYTASSGQSTEGWQQNWLFDYQAATARQVNDQPTARRQVN